MTSNQGIKANRQRVKALNQLAKSVLDSAFQSAEAAIPTFFHLNKAPIDLNKAPIDGIESGFRCATQVENDPKKLVVLSIVHGLMPAYSGCRSVSWVLPKLDFHHDGDDDGAAFRARVNGARERAANMLLHRIDVA